MRTRNIECSVENGKAEQLRVEPWDVPTLAETKDRGHCEDQNRLSLGGYCPWRRERTERFASSERLASGVGLYWIREKSEWMALDGTVHH
jgi:hypothetical protein